MYMFFIRYFSLSCVLLFLFSCDGENKKEKQREEVQINSSIEFEKNYYQFGDIKSGEIVGCYFSFVNTGDFPIIIKKIDAGCGCTTVKYPKELIEPNQKGEIEVRFNSKGLKGHQYKAIHVYANIDKEYKELVISANVIN